MKFAAFNIFVVLLISLSWNFTFECACGKDIFVDNVRGDDAASGEFEEVRPDGTGPVRSLAKALDLATRGDRIFLQKTDRPYREPVSLSGGRLSGYPANPFTIVGNGAVIDGSAPVPASLWEHYKGDVYRFQSRYIRYQQLFIDGRPLIRAPVTRSTKSLPELGAMDWCVFRGYVYFAAEAGKRPEDYALSHAKSQAGISLNHVSYVKIVDIELRGFQLDGVSAVTAARDVSLERVTCRANGRSGVCVGGSSHVSIEQCYFGENGEAQLLTLPLSRTEISKSQLPQKTAPAWMDRGGDVFMDGFRIKGGLFPDRS